MIREFLESMELMMSKTKACKRLKARTGAKHNTQVGFVLEHGREMPWTYDPNLEWREIKQCYKNAFYLVMEDPGNLTYCEGWAAGIIPTQHAWVLDASGTVIDPTWRREEERGYFGIAFDWDFVYGEIINSETYGVIDKWEDGWPLLVGGQGYKPDDFLHKEQSKCLA